MKQVATSRWFRRRGWLARLVLEQERGADELLAKAMMAIALTMQSRLQAKEMN